MAKLTNEFVRFTGHLQSFATELARRLEKSGVNLPEAVSRAVQPENAHVLDTIAEALGRMAQAAKNVFRLTVGGTSTEELVRAGNYTCASPKVTSTNC